MKNLSAPALQVLSQVWKFAKSDEALGILKVVAALAACVHAVEELRQMNRVVGFRPEPKSKSNGIGFKR